MDSLAVLYARELSRWSIETTIVVPGAFTKGTNHFAHSGRRLTRRGSRNMKLAPKILPTYSLLDDSRALPSPCCAIGVKAIEGNEQLSCSELTGIRA